MRHLRIVLDQHVPALLVDEALKFLQRRIFPGIHAQPEAHAAIHPRHQRRLRARLFLETTRGRQRCIPLAAIERIADLRQARVEFGARQSGFRLPRKDLFRRRILPERGEQVGIDAIEALAAQTFVFLERRARLGITFLRQVEHAGEVVAPPQTRVLTGERGLQIDQRLFVVLQVERPLIGHLVVRAIVVRVFAREQLPLVYPRRGRSEFRQARIEHQGLACAQARTVLVGLREIGLGLAVVAVGQVQAGPRRIRQREIRILFQRQVEQTHGLAEVVRDDRGFVGERVEPQRIQAGRGDLRQRLAVGLDVAHRFAQALAQFRVHGIERGEGRLDAASLGRLGVHGDLRGRIDHFDVHPQATADFRHRREQQRARAFAQRDLAADGAIDRGLAVAAHALQRRLHLQFRHQVDVARLFEADAQGRVQRLFQARIGGEVAHVADHDPVALVESDRRRALEHRIQ